MIRRVEVAPVALAGAACSLLRRALPPGVRPHPVSSFLSAQPLINEHVRFFMYQILRGLRYMHSANVLHRDLKPQNLLVNADCSVAICDFGLSRYCIDPAKTKLTQYVVTRSWRAPELLCECRNYGSAVDVWSCGVIMAEVMTRRPLLNGITPIQIFDSIVQLLGSPSAEDIKAIADLGAPPPVVELLRTRYPPIRPLDLAALMPGAAPEALAILSKMLVFNPLKRITAEVRARAKTKGVTADTFSSYTVLPLFFVQEALRHPYFKDAGNPETIAPVCPSVFDFSYEKGWPKGMPIPLLKKHMLEEMEILKGLPPVEPPLPDAVMAGAAARYAYFRPAPAPAPAPPAAGPAPPASATTAASTVMYAPVQHPAWAPAPTWAMTSASSASSASSAATASFQPPRAR
jgi:hypothetical protein